MISHEAINVILITMSCHLVRGRPRHGQADHGEGKSKHEQEQMTVINVEFITMLLSSGEAINQGNHGLG